MPTLPSLEPRPRAGGTGRGKPRTWPDSLLKGLYGLLRVDLDALDVNQTDSVHRAARGWTRPRAPCRTQGTQRCVGPSRAARRYVRACKRGGPSCSRDVCACSSSTMQRSGPMVPRSSVPMRASLARRPGSSCRASGGDLRASMRRGGSPIDSRRRPSCPRRGFSPRRGSRPRLAVHRTPIPLPGSTKTSP